MSPSSVPEARIDLAALAWNYRFLREKAAPGEAGAVVKANAYGLGAGPVCRTLAEAGCRTFFTAHFSEALEVRALLPDATVVVMHGVTESDSAEAIRQCIIPVINHLDSLKLWKELAHRQGGRLPVFIHLDTGINRLGLSPDEQKLMAKDPALLEGLEVKAWMSHLACADEASNPMTVEQRDRFVSALRLLPKAPASLCNSSGLFWGKDYVFDLARPGLALYGGNPAPHLPNPMRAVLELRAPILQVRDVDTNMTIGYGAAHRVEGRGRVATLALGYADGYHRALGERGTVMIGGHPAPLIGRISMDSVTVDVTNVPEEAARVGAMATLIGSHRAIDDAAREGGTIAYEILTSLGARIERVYQGSGAA